MSDQLSTEELYSVSVIFLNSYAVDHFMFIHGFRQWLEFELSITNGILDMSHTLCTVLSIISR